MFMLFVFGTTAAVDGATHLHSVAKPEDDAFGEFLSGMPTTSVSLQSSVSPVAASSVAEANAYSRDNCAAKGSASDVEDGSHTQDDCATGSPAPVKQSQTGSNCCDSDKLNYS